MDPWVEERNYHELKDKLNARGELQSGFRHYSIDDEITELPIVLRYLKQLH